MNKCINNDIFIYSYVLMNYDDHYFIIFQSLIFLYPHQHCPLFYFHEKLEIRFDENSYFYKIVFCILVDGESPHREGTKTAAAAGAG